MTSLEALALALGVSIALGFAVTAVLFKPLQALLARVCSGHEAVVFWERFTILMLFLSPVFVSVVWGVPPRKLLESEDVGGVLQSIITSGLVGTFLAVLGMGIWVSALIRRAPGAPAGALPKKQEFGD